VRLAAIFGFPDDAVPTSDDIAELVVSAHVGGGVRPADGRLCETLITGVPAWRRRCCGELVSAFLNTGAGTMSESSLVTSPSASSSARVPTILQTLQERQRARQEQEVSATVASRHAKTRFAIGDSPISPSSPPRRRATAADAPHTPYWDGLPPEAARARLSSVGPFGRRANTPKQRRFDGKGCRSTSSFS
jgi:hypothetical protein